MIELALKHPEAIISSECGDKYISTAGNISIAEFRVKGQI